MTITTEKKHAATKSLKVLRSGDPATAFHKLSAAQILKRYGPPTYILSSSTKTKKCRSVGVLAKALYFTPGVFCPDATPGCLAACLGHCSGHMQMPTHALARDRRTALYLDREDLFLAMLRVEFDRLALDAKRQRLRPAVRLNGTSDLAWEELHPELFASYPQIEFFDYTKVTCRMKRFLQRESGQAAWPSNYHLTFSASATNHPIAKKVLAAGGNVAVVFWPEVPRRFWNRQVINGDRHDARFLDEGSQVVGLAAKGRARIDATGFTIHTARQSQRVA